jgi:hypothetical protein
MEVPVWIPCKVELAARKRKPKWAYVTIADVAGELREGMSVMLYFRQQDGNVLVATGEVVRVMKGGVVRIRTPWFVAASLAEWAGVSIAEASGKIAVYNCALQYEILEEAEEKGGIRIRQVAEDE